VLSACIRGYFMLAACRAATARRAEPSLRLLLISSLEQEPVVMPTDSFPWA
jgi:hypothetical protein